jgi:hypothetical protein
MRAPRQFPQHIHGISPIARFSENPATNNNRRIGGKDRQRLSTIPYRKRF